MSGYLQRLSASVFNSADAIHPMVRPLFSVSKDAMAAAPPSIDDASGTAAHPEPQQVLHPHSDTPSQRMNSVAEHHKTIRSDSGDLSNPVARATAPQVPRRALDIRYDVAAGVRRPQQGESSAEDAPAESATIFEPSERAEGSTPPRLPRADPDYVPLVAEGFSSLESVGVPSVRSPQSESATGRRAGSVNPSRHRDPVSNVDEIEIHIGRIEATAVQAAPGPSARPKAVRSARTLNEYLRSRDSRTS